MDIAALIVSVVALVASFGSLILFKRRDQRESSRWRVERTPRFEMEYDGGYPRPDVTANPHSNSRRLTIRLLGPEKLSTARITMLQSGRSDSTIATAQAGQDRSTLSKPEEWSILDTWSITLGGSMPGPSPRVEFELETTNDKGDRWTERYDVEDQRAPKPEMP